MTVTFDYHARVNGPLDLGIARVFIQDRRVRIYSARGRQAELAAEFDVIEDPMPPRGRVPLIMTTSDGAQWTVTRAACNCGSPLKRLRASVVWE